MTVANENMDKEMPIENSRTMKTELNPRTPLRDHFIFCAIFALVFTAFMAIQNLQTSLNQEANVGAVSLITIYATCGIVSFLSPVIVSTLGAKWSLALGWTGHCLFVAANFYPVMGTMIPASLILGFVATPIWTTQGLYVMTTALKYAELTVKDTSATLVKFNGIFWTFFQSTQITGNLVSSLILYTDTGISVNNDTELCGSLDCPSVAVSVNGTNATTDSADNAVSMTTIYTVMGIFAGLDVLGLILTILFLKPLSQTHIKLEERIKSFFKHFSKRDVLLLLPLYTLNGYEQAFMFGDFTKVSQTSRVLAF